jgi:isoleucyl-tRNA synthetase
MTTKNERVQNNAPLNGPDMAGSNQQGAEKSSVALSEEAVLSFWQENKIFEKTLAKNLPENNKNSKGEFVFYDGPPFATGLPHYGHLLAGTLKDAIPRYKTMRGYHVPRKWGWDCHGLPIESLIQKENNLNTKKDIEAFGIKKFSQAAKASVFRYDAEWRKTVPRLGRFIDMDNQYTTMDSGFMESVWWAFSELYKKGLVYEDFKVMHISPLLETPLSNSEVSQNYKDITDISATVKMELIDEPGTYLLAWTTTPWTLMGNVALAVGNDIDYVKVEIENSAENEKGKFILAKALLEKVLKDKKYSVIAEMKGSDLVSKKYKPLFNYYSQNQNLENRENGWKVYAADFVTTEDGTGIVHIATAFGEDDFNLGKKHNLPFVQHVNMDGTIKSEVTDFAGLQAKPKATNENQNAHQNTDIEVIKYLAHTGTLFSKEKIIHPYPHCERTGAPLLNYALSSWFVKVTDLREKMVELNKNVHWVPETIGTKRFGNWLENAKDWGISRSRYWGSTIPIWRSEDGEIEVIDSVETLKNKVKSTNKYFLARHGESDHNVGQFISSDDSVKSNLTEKGLKEAEEIGQSLLNVLSKENKKIDLIFCSPLHRTKNTAEIIAEKIGFDKSQIIIEDRIKETQLGILNGKTKDEYVKLIKGVENQFYQAPEGGETLTDIKKRVGDFIYEVDKKYEGKNILIVTHEYPIWMLHTIKGGIDNKKAALNKTLEKHYVKTGHFEEYDFARIPHDDEYILDLHRPYIDEVTYQKNGKTFTRIPEVFDTWFDSGSMPYAVPHFPFSVEKNEKGFIGKILEKISPEKEPAHFPADFIAEGLDQTRGWFYTLMVLNSALFGKAPFKNVLVNGMALAEDGRKMSKSLRNYPDPMYIIDKYGADALRYYMLTSPIVKAEPLNFSEKGVDEVLKKVINRLLNVVSFYELYVDDSASQKIFEQYENNPKKIPNTNNVLDEWILALFEQTKEKVTTSLEKYELDSATRPIADFADDLSTWYLRRSRDRFKGDDAADFELAKEVTHFILINLAKIMAPFMPFMAEDIYQRISGFRMKDSAKSVNLENWPTQKSFDNKVLENMQKVRDIVALGLEARDKLKIKVRQPLQTLKINQDLSTIGDQMINLIKDEVNVKEFVFDPSLESAENNLQVSLSSEITPELLEEGIAREIIRLVQSLRKKSDLNPEDKIDLMVETDDAGKELIQKFTEQIKKPTNIVNFVFSENDGELISADKYSFKLKLK